MQRTDTNSIYTHEQHLQAIRSVVLPRLNGDDRERLMEAKLVYGTGSGPRMRGRCLYDTWQRNETTALIEICALGEQSKIQFAGTALHEFAHCIAGQGTGHGKAWKDACRTLGLVRCTATSQAYSPEDFSPEVWAELTRLPDPTDGNPVRATDRERPSTPAMPSSAPPCPAGVGTRDGNSRGPGSGSRLRLFMCQCAERPYRARVASDTFLATCNRCGSKFERVTAKERPRTKPFLFRYPRRSLRVAHGDFTESESRISGIEGTIRSV